MSAWWRSHAPIAKELNNLAPDSERQPVGQPERADLWGDTRGSNRKAAHCVSENDQADRITARATRARMAIEMAALRVIVFSWALLAPIGVNRRRARPWEMQARSQQAGIL